MLNLNKSIYFIFATFFVILLFYFPGLHNDFFIVDDHELILIPQLKVEMSFQLLQTLFTPGTHVDFYPIRDLTYWVDIHFLGGDLQGVDAFAYRLQNFFWFGLSAVLIYFISINYLKNKLVALLISIFWLVHPVHSEMLMWASARKDILAIFFLLLTIYFYIVYDQKKNWAHFILTCLAFVFCVLSKATFGLVPLALFIGNAKNSLNRMLLALGVLGSATQVYFYSASTDMRFDYELTYRIQASLIALGKAAFGWVFPSVNVVDIENWGQWVEFNHNYIYVGYAMYALGLGMLVYSIRLWLRSGDKVPLQIFLALMLSYFPISGLVFSHRNFYSVRYFEAPFLFVIAWCAYCYMRFRNDRQLKDSERVFVVISLVCLLASSYVESKNWSEPYSPLEKAYKDQPQNPSIQQRLFSAFQNENRWGRLDPERVELKEQLLNNLKKTCLDSEHFESRNGNLCQSFWLSQVESNESSVSRLSIERLKESWKDVYRGELWPIYWFRYLKALDSGDPYETKKYGEKLALRPAVQLNRSRVRQSVILPLCLLDSAKASVLLADWQRASVIDQDFINSVLELVKEKGSDNYVTVKRCLESVSN
jgi:hypothetical protein